MDLVVNGNPSRLDVDPERDLLGVLRDELDLTGTKYGCGEGRCGACTVLVDGAATRSCVTRVAAAAGRRVTTIEGLASGERLHPVQRAFLEEQALQCGYCTPGMILGAVALLEAEPEPSDALVLRRMESHLCRCGAYPRILAAIHRAAAETKEGGR